MKTVSKRLGLLAKLGLLAGMLATGQQAVAQTAAGVTVDNEATVTFTVGGVLQDAVTSDTASFVVDRRVAFSIVRTQTDLTPVTPGQTDQFVEFRLRNDSNSTLDFLLSDSVAPNGTEIRSGEFASGSVMDNTRIRVAATPTTGANPTPDLGTVIENITGLATGEEILIRIYADTPTGLLNADIAGLILEGVAALSGTELTETAGADRPDQIDNVFVDGADGDGFASQTEVEGFTVSAATVGATKTAATVSDPINGLSADAKPIPGAFVEYTFTLENTGSVAADNVTITDALNTTQTVLRDASYEGDAGAPVGANVRFDGTAWCVADADGADGCTYDAGTGNLVITLPDPIAIGGTAVVEFQVVVQ